MKATRLALHIFAVSLVISIPCSAFEDPSGLMPQLDTFLANKSFSQAFHSGDKFQILRTNCEKAANHCSKMRSRYEVLFADSKSGKVATYIGDRPEPSSIAKVTQQQWSQISGNMARNIVRELESYGAKVTLTELRELWVTVDVNDLPVRQPAMELTFLYRTTLTPQATQQIVLTNDLRGPGQIVRKFIDDGLGGETLTELTSCKLGDRLSP